MNQKQNDMSTYLSIIKLFLSEELILFHKSKIFRMIVRSCPVRSECANPILMCYGHHTSLLILSFFLSVSLHVHCVLSCLRVDG